MKSIFIPTTEKQKYADKHQTSYQESTNPKNKTLTRGEVAYPSSRFGNNVIYKKRETK
ncbi:MAG: hypothetical protein IJ419_08440 [Agathobacter sp.]|nr:hypothetical protein [Agathobacter sp.]